MSKPVYEIPVNGDESEQPLSFPPPARDARPRNLSTAPPPAAGHPAAPTYSSAPEAPFTSPPPTLAPDGSALGAPASLAPPPAPAAPAAAPSAGHAAASGAIDASAAFSAPMPDGAWAAATPAPQPASPPAEQFVPPAAADLSFPPPSADAGFAPPTAESMSFAEQMFAADGVSSTLAVADQDLISALSEVLFLNASDLHVAVNTPPMFRVDGTLGPRSITTPWSREKVTTALRSILTEAQLARFDEELELDIAYTISANARFRVNMYQQRGAIGAAFRLIPTEIKTLVDLGVPETVSQFATLPRGLVLVTG
ncbi:MAG TPA: type IV pili twitching motility protein PilT, partial [Galbitalea sp.]|nr:type IV pili twitching motility protein PilT [Galbitalea sp.]